MLERTGQLETGEDGLAEWQTTYRSAFYSRYEFQVPSVHYDGLLPQTNDAFAPERGTQIFEACEP